MGIKKSYYGLPLPSKLGCTHVSQLVYSAQFIFQVHYTLKINLHLEYWLIQIKYKEASVPLSPRVWGKRVLHGVWTQILIYHCTVFLFCQEHNVPEKVGWITLFSRFFPLGPPLWEPNFHAVIHSLPIEQSYISVLTSNQSFTANYRRKSSWIFQPKAFSWW